MKNTLKTIILVVLILFSFNFAFSQDEDLPDILAQKPFAKEMKVKISREDSNFLYYRVQKGGAESKVDWSRVALIRYGEESQNLSIAEDQLSGDTPNFAGALNSFEKVINDKRLSKWQLDRATYASAICLFKLGNIEKAKERLLSIKNDSRWFYPAKLRMIDTLPDKDKVSAIKNLLKGADVTGAFKIELYFMLVDRNIADENGNEAKLSFDELKKNVNTPDKLLALQLDEFQIKIDVMNKNFAEAEKKIRGYITSGTETGLMRIALGDIYLGKNEKMGALFEYLRGRLDFPEVSAEGSFKAGRLFSLLWQEDKTANADYRGYAKKELGISSNVGDGIWSNKAAKMLSQLK